MSVALAIPSLAAEWDKITVRLRADMDEDAYTSWCMSIRLEQFNGAVLVLSVPTLFLRRHLEKHYAAALLTASQAVLGNVTSIVLRVRQPQAKPALVVVASPEVQQRKQITDAFTGGSDGGAMTVERAAQLVSDMVPSPEPRHVTVDDIVRAVVNRFSVTKVDLLSDRRDMAIVRPRQIGMYLARTLTTLSMPYIGRRFGGRDHTTVLHAIRKITKLQESDSALAEDIATLTLDLQYF